jgi:transposase
MEHRQWVDSISHETVSRILRNHRLQVHRVKYWKTSHDPNFLEKMRVIVSHYLNPPPGKLIISVDEMPSIQALERIAQPTINPGKVRRIEFEYKRHGTVNLFAALNVKSGEVFGETKQNKKHADFLSFMKNVDAFCNYQQMIVIVDNYKTHNHQLVKEWIKQQDGRIEFVFTPYHGSWLNQIEIWFGILRRYCLKHTSFTSIDELSDKMLNFITSWNKNFAHPFKWKFVGW